MLKIFISDYTYRTEAKQLEKLSEHPDFSGAPIFRPADLSTMFRATQRSEIDTYYAASLACLAETEDRLLEFLAGCRQRRACIGTIEELFEWRPGQSNAGIVKAWKLARVRGSAKAGANISKANRLAISKKACDAIEPFWHLPNQEYATDDLLKAANKSIGKRGRLHYRTAIKHLGRRPIEQANYQAARTRKERREQRAN
jgi:hypothetical protein